MNDSNVFADLADETLNIFLSIGSILPYLVGFIAIIVASQTIWHRVRNSVDAGDSFNSLKTVTSGGLLLVHNYCPVFYTYLARLWVVANLPTRPITAQVKSIRRV